MEINCKYCPKNDGTGNCLINGCPYNPQNEAFRLSITNRIIS
jgi:hypothetical protein